MARLTGEIVTFIVTRLACYDRPTEVQAAALETFKLSLDLPQIMYYDPTFPSSAGVGKKWRRLFMTTRARFLKETADIPIANRAVRLRRLERLANKAEDMKNIPVAGQLLEQAAKETGDFYTNKRIMLPGDPADELAKMLGLSKDDLVAALANADA